MNIYEKMLTISNELKVVKKNLNVGYGSGSYKAVSEADVIAEVKFLEVKYGIYSYPYEREIVESKDLTSTKTEYDKSGNPHERETVTHFMRLKTTYRFLNTEKPEEYIDMVTYGDGVDTGDKACGKAETYCDKYALMKAYKMITGDDPEQWKSYDPDDDNIDPNTGEVIEILTDEVQKKMDELGIKKENVAAYFKKDVKLITNDDCNKAIEMKEKALKKKVN
jgi:hypothetical protein